jgi:hypothetical protein
VVADTMSEGAIPASANMAAMLAQTVSAWSPTASGTVPSGRMGTTPAVCRMRSGRSDNIAWR